MKFLLFMLIFVSITFCHNMLIHKSDGSTIKYDIAGIQKITFDLRGIVDIKKIPKISKIISNIYPNPFNPIVNIEYIVTHKGNVDIAIYDLSGRIVKQIKKGIMMPGNYKVVWNGKDCNSRKVSSGVYVCKIKTNNYSIQKKMFLIQ